MEIFQLNRSKKLPYLVLLLRIGIRIILESLFRIRKQNENQGSGSKSKPIRIRIVATEGL
jgi:hypothetical protein